MILFTLGNSSDAFIILGGQERGLNVLQVMGMGSWGSFGLAAPFYFGAAMSVLASILFLNWVR